MKINGHLCNSACTLIQIGDGHGTTHHVYSVWKPMIINEHLNQNPLCVGITSPQSVAQNLEPTINDKRCKSMKTKEDLHQRVACICAFAMAEPLAAMGKRCRPVDDHAEPVANRARVVPPPKVVLPPPRDASPKYTEQPSRSPQVCYTAIHTVVHRSSLHR